MTGRNNWISQLYYGKFPYKIRINLPGVHYLRGNPSRLGLIRTYCNTEADIRTKSGSSYLRFQQPIEIDFLNNFKIIAKLHKKLNLLDPEKYKIRIEGSIISIYFINKTNSESFFYEFSNIITNYYKPKNKHILKFLKNIKKNQRYVEAFPWGGYCYRVHINSTKINKLTDTRRRNFKEWVDTINKNNENNQKIKLTSSLTEFLGEKTRKYYCNSTHFHVKDKEHLVMCYLYLGDVVDSVIEFILYNDTDDLLSRTKNA